MMKRTLIMVLVLAIVSTANAALSWSVSAIEVDPAVGAMVTINSSDALAYAEVWIEDIAGGVIGSIEALPSAGDASKVKDPAASGYEGYWTVEGADLNPDDGGMSDGAQYNVTLTGTVDQYCNTYPVLLDIYGVNEELSVHIIPEPITLALLGLGGLFLRRRK
jgi:hypothetical protein